MNTLYLFKGRISSVRGVQNIWHLKQSCSIQNELKSTFKVIVCLFQILTIRQNSVFQIVNYCMCHSLPSSCVRTHNPLVSWTSQEANNKSFMIID